MLAGGIGQERQVSLQTGQTIAGGCKNAGFDVVTSDITPENLSILDDSSIDVFFPALHGSFGEDGQIQKIMEDKKLKFVGSGSKASKIAFDKTDCKKIWQNNNIPIPRHSVVDEKTDFQNLMKDLADKGEHFVVKPAMQGSSVGVEIVRGAEFAAAAAVKCQKRFGKTMVEEFISGREITVGILGKKPLPIIEIRSRTGFYDYNAKYIESDTQYIFDTITDKKQIEKINQTALNCFNVLNCRHLARVDFIMSQEKPVVLEINTMPGFTSHSLFPKSAAKKGIALEKVCEILINSALKD